MNAASSDWIIASQSIHGLHNIHNLLNATELRYDQNIVIAFPDDQYKNKNVLCDGMFEYRPLKFLKKVKTCSQEQFRSRICTKVENGMSYYRSSKKYLNLAKKRQINRNDHEIPLLGSGNIGFNFTRKFYMKNASELLFNTSSILKQSTTWIHAVQYFKVRVNSTLYASYLGNYAVYFYV